MTGRFGGYEDQEFVAEFYDPVYDKLRQKDVKFFIDYAKRVKEGTLELGCGTGRILIPTAICGCEITGLDLSPHMLQKCREKLDRQPREVQERVSLIQGNMTDFKTGETYALIMIPFRAFQHLTSAEEQKACLDCANKHLTPQGLLILDLFHPFLPRLYDSQYMNEVEDVTDLKLPDGRNLRRTTRTAAFHRDEQYSDVEIIYYVTHLDGRAERLVQAFPMRYSFRYEVEHLLSICGFRVVNLFGDFDRSAFSSDSPEMIFVAEKQ